MKLKNKLVLLGLALFFSCANKVDNVTGVWEHRWSDGVQACTKRLVFGNKNSGLKILEQTSKMGQKTSSLQVIEYRLKSDEVLVLAENYEENMAVEVKNDSVYLIDSNKETFVLKSKDISKYN